LKIAFVANTSWNIYNFRRGLVHYFLGKGFEVMVLTPKDEYTDALIEWGIKWMETELDGTGVNPIKDVKYLIQLKKIIKEERPQFIFGYTIKSNIYACLAARGMSIPVICNVSGLGTAFLVKGLTAQLALGLYKVAFRTASFVFFQNEDDKYLFLSKVKLPDQKIGLLPGSGIDLKEFSYTPPVIKKPTKFLMISRLIIEKGVREFAEAASHFADDDSVNFTLVGRFDESHSRSIQSVELKNWIDKKWLTYIPHSDQIKKLIETHEVIVLPSYREGTPRTLLEGAAMGRTLLASDVPGCREVVEDGVNGFLFDVKSAPSLTKKIRLYLSLSVDEREKLSVNSRNLVEKKFDENLVIRKYSDLIQKINSSA